VITIVGAVPSNPNGVAALVPTFPAPSTARTTTVYPFPLVNADAGNG